MENISDIIRTRIKQARHEAGLNQKSLAELLGMSSPATISRYEKGDLNVSADILYRIALVTNKPISFFYEISSTAQTGKDLARDYEALNETGQQRVLQCLQDMLKLYPR